MKSTFVTSREFIRGTARYADLVFIISKNRKAIEKDIAHADVIANDGGEWADAEVVEWDSSAIAVATAPTVKLIVVGEDGDVLRYAGGESVTEKITPPPVLINNAITIDGKVFACGMKRQVYERVDEGVWQDISAPFPEPGEKVGFESIDGYSRREIYAVGWQGEIWQFDGTHWHNRGSLTNKILTSVCCAQDGSVYIAGQQGVMIKGRHGQWEIIEWDDETDADFWDLCWFQDKLYVATMSGLFTLEGNELVAVDFGDTPEPESYYSLTTAEGVLWSIGENDVASFDGQTWRIYE